MGAGNNKGKSDRFPELREPSLGLCRLTHRPHLTPTPGCGVPVRTVKGNGCSGCRVGTQEVSTREGRLGNAEIILLGSREGLSVGG